MFKDRHVALVVAVEGVVDWAAYSLVDCNRDHLWLKEHSLNEFIDRVAESGDKISQDVAERLFPHMRGQTYRL